MTNELPGIKDIAWASLGTQLRDGWDLSRRPGERQAFAGTHKPRRVF
jgi:hypothetical protein